MSKPVVLVAEELAPSALDVLSSDFELRHVDGADRSALLPALVGVDAVLIRSATKMDAEAVAAATQLKVIARAGVGLDNVDIKAATAAGVMVVNAPTSNIVSAAEHAVALLLAAARRIPAANASLKGGAWKRSKYTGVEVNEKTIGVVGFGKIGQLFAHRLKAFDTTIIAYDPYISAARAAQLGVRLVSLDDLMRESDFISIHLPKTPETKGLISDRELALCKPSVIIINAARGGLVDEAALAKAIEEGRVGGAGIDVYEVEPCTDSPLFALGDSVVVTPHLGASTDEAQDKAGTAVAKSVKLALQGEFVPDAVNVQSGGVVAEEVRPALGLMETLGRVFTALAGTVPAELEVLVRGEIAVHDVQILQLSALKGVFTDVVEQQVTFVNAPLLAQERNVQVHLTSSEDSPDYRNLLTVRGTLATGEQFSVSGTLSGPKHVAKLVEVDGFDVDLTISEHLAFFRYHDEPGVVGKLGNVLGARGVNIAGAMVARQTVGGDALMALTVDTAVPADVLTEIATAIGATSARAVDLDEA
ncbi:phosphoglycerate dehydrogenase [Acidothermaceae bacterium B102]|nr:phosphoglycerate dehydrogenase [Acidothermaceae bacterium B102]